MNLFILVFIMLFSSVGFSQKNCWRKEIDYKTKKVYLSEKKYQDQVKNWTAFNTINPSPMSLAKAYLVYKNEVKITEEFTNDKIQHCYLGCRIAAETDYDTAHFTGWNKEKEDLTDCKVSTHFEILDYKATVDGGNNPGSQAHCKKYCLARW